MVPVCDKRYHIYNRFRHFWAEIKKLWNYPFTLLFLTREQTLTFGGSQHFSHSYTCTYVTHQLTRHVHGDC